MRSRTTGVAIGAVLVPLLTIALGAAPASAHPLGNATVNHYDGLHLYPDRLTVTSVEDVAEIPTYQRHGDIDRDGNGTLSAQEQSGYAAAQCSALARTASVTVAGQRIPLQVTASAYSERAGAIGLRAGRLDCALEGRADLSRDATVAFTDSWDGQGIGWHEVTAVGTGVTLQGSPFPAASISDELRRYPGNLLSSPLDVRSGTIRVTPGSGLSTYRSVERLPVAGPAVRALNRLATSFNEVASTRHLTLGVGLLALVLSLLLGAGHAFLPGHGKTIMAAYLVGRRGRVRDVVTVGATVTLTHTLGVLVLGLAITTTTAFAPTQAEQYLGVLSGVIVAAVGIGLLVSAVRRRHRPVLATALHDTPEVGEVVSDLHLDGHGTTVPGRAVAGLQPAGGTLLATPAAGAQPHDHDGGHRHDGGGDPHGHDDGHDHDHAGDGYDDAHDHAHGHGHDHPTGHDDGQGREAAGSHRHGFGRAHSHTPIDKSFSRGGLIGLGVAGGLVPSPSALLVLLAATALGRTAFGVLLVLGYGVGMAGALSVAGLLLVKVRGRLDRFAGSSRLARADRLLAVLPILTALLVLAVGIGLSLRALGGSV